MRELKIGDRVVDWKDRAGVVLSVQQDGGWPNFTVRNDDGAQMYWSWSEFSSSDVAEWEGTFRFEDTEYPEWPR